MKAAPITNQNEKALISPGSTKAAGFLALTMTNSIIKGRPIETNKTKIMTDWRILFLFLKVLKSLEAII